MSYDGDDEYMPYQPPQYGASYTGAQPHYGPDSAADQAQGFADDQKPKILLMGLRRSGKSSIQNVVFHKMSPNETLFLESTNKITTDDITNTSCVQFKILDFPGQIDFFDPSFDTENIFGGVGALVFVIDAQDDYIDAVDRLGETAKRVYKINPKLNFEVFVHKVDGLSDDTKIETQRDIHQRASDDLIEADHDHCDVSNIHYHFYLTSIYDHSIFEAFSKVVQRLIPELPTLENLLNVFNTNSGIEKSLLFDVSSKIYIATDYSPVDMQSYELCCDMIDVVLDISSIYGLEDDGSDHMLCFDSETCSVIKLNNNTVLLLWHVARYLALVCILREENYDRPGLIDYNYHYLKKGINEIFEVRQRHRQIDQQRMKLRLAASKGPDSVEEAGNSNIGLEVLGPQTSTPVGRSDSTVAPNLLRTMGNMTPSAIHSSLEEQYAAVRQKSEDRMSRASGAAGSQQEAIDANSMTEAAGVTNSDVRSSSAFRSVSDNVLLRRSPTEVTNAAGVAYRTTSEYVPPSNHADVRHASSSVGPAVSANGSAGGAAGGGPVRQLARGHVITTGGSRSDTATPVSSGVVGNTYVMTDDAGMVLVNGASANTASSVAAPLRS